MSLTYGFFDSVNGDRKYSADEFAGFLDGIVYDGVYQAVGNKFYVEAYGGMTVTVDTGRAWFDHTYTLNTTKLAVEIPIADTVYPRKDAIVIEVNKQDRQNYIKVVQGTPSEAAAKPILKKESQIIQYAIAYVTVDANATEITQEKIEYVVDSDETPLCSALALAGIPSGGTTGQVLAKESSESGRVGWHDVTRLPSDLWYLPNGVDETDVIAAWRFKGAETELDALKNVNQGGTVYNLTKSTPNITWSAAAGFYIPGTADIGLNNTDVYDMYPIGTVAVKYADASSSTNIMCGIFGSRLTSGSTCTRGMWIRTPATATPKIALNSSSSTQFRYCLYETNSVASSMAVSGVISGNFGDTSPKMHFNGINCALTSVSSSADNGLADNAKWNYLFGQCKAHTSPTFGSYYIHAAVVFNRNLSDDEIAGLYTLMEGV